MLPRVSEVLVGPDGVRVERILVQRHLDRPAREMLRVRRGTYLVAACAATYFGGTPMDELAWRYGLPAPSVTSKTCSGLMIRPR